MPKVSVIIPNYNHASFLKERVDSVLNQTYQDFEVIILDDCSTDSSKDVIEQFRTNPKVREIIYNQTNSGTTFKQWRKGIELAEGEYIWLAESDDFASPYLLEKLVALFDKHPAIGLAYCNSLIVDEHSEITDDTRKWNRSLHEEGQALHKTGIVNGRSFCFDHLIYLNVIPNASAVLFKKDIVFNNPDWIDCSLRNAGDWKLWLNILLRYDFGYLCEDLNYFRKHSTNVTGSIFRIKLEILKILKEIKGEIRTKDELYSLFDSIFIWSFKQVYWAKNFSLNHSNVRFYFKNNISTVSIKYFFQLFSFYIIENNPKENDKLNYS